MEKSAKWMTILHQNCSFSLQVNKNKNLKVYQRSLNREDIADITYCH